MSLISETGEYVPARWVLSMSCVNGDEIQAAIHEHPNIAFWLGKLDHEGSSWIITDMKTGIEYGPEEEIPDV